MNETQLANASSQDQNSPTLINSKLPDFKLQAYCDNEFKTVTTADFLGRWSVLFFYPADFTFVCPTELEDLAENYGQFKELNTEIYSVSTDTHFTHKAWHDTSPAVGKVNYPMLADPTGFLTKWFGIYIPEEGLAYRGTFVINPDAEVKLAEVCDNGIGRNSGELLRKLKAAQFVREHDGEVCPAKWNPGEETLKPSLDLVGKF